MQETRKICTSENGPISATPEIFLFLKMKTPCIYPIVGLRLQKCCLKILFKKSSLMIMDHQKTVCILIIILSILSHCSLQPKINTHFKHNFVSCNIFRVPCKRGSMCPGRCRDITKSKGTLSDFLHHHTNPTKL